MFNKNISDYWENLNGRFDLTDTGKGQVVILLKQFTFQEVLDAMDIAIVKYYKGDRRSIEFAFDKIGGICYNRRKQAEEKRQGGD